jgi:hypothetical protein
MQMWNVDGCSGNIENVGKPKKKEEVKSST